MSRPLPYAALQAVVGQPQRWRTVGRYPTLVQAAAASVAPCARRAGGRVLANDGRLWAVALGSSGLRWRLLPLGA